MLIYRIFALTAFLLITTAQASSTIKLAIGQWSFDTIQAENLQFNIDLTETGLAVIAQAKAITLDAPVGKVTNIRLHCDVLHLLANTFSCKRGTLSFWQRNLGQQNIAFKVSGEPEKNQYKITITGLNIASAKLSTTVYLNNNYWRLVTNAPKITLVELQKYAVPYLEQQQLEMLDEWEIEGDTKLSLDLSGRLKSISKLALNLATTALNVTDNDSRYVTENVALTLDIDAKHNKQKWQWKTALKVAKGQAYGEPIFIDFSLTPVTVKATGIWLPKKGVINVNNAVFNQQNVVAVTADYQGSLEKVDQFNIAVSESNIIGLYEHWIQPFVVGTAIDNLDLRGHVSMEYHQLADNYYLSLDLKDVFVDDNLARFSVDAINGYLGWANYKHTMKTDIQWDKAIVYAIPIGKSRLQAKTNSSSLTLSQQWNVPIFDGELKINKFNLHRPGEQGAKWTFDGQLTPISMEQVSSALGWPILHGQLSGTIPNVSYSNQHIKVDGLLTVNLFEGKTIIKDLELEQPFGALPQLYANIEMKGMNLSTLSRTFDFGEISGKLDGKILGLRLSNWRPVEMEAYFATPKNDKSRHRISQKAINNLSKVGGGVGGALQRSFLRFFEDFSYKRLGLSCRLHNEVCEMSGVSEAENGYYIVKGGGFPPRINVVGYTRRVDWPDLIKRLKAVSQSSEPVVIE
jgi:hypothetical protein